VCLLWLGPHFFLRTLSGQSVGTYKWGKIVPASSVLAAFALDCTDAPVPHALVSVVCFAGAADLLQDDPQSI